MKRLLAAIQFLTVLPIPCTCTEREIGRSTLFFPVVGLLIGGGIAGLNYLLSAVFPPLLVAVLLAIAMVAISGGLHIDGLADTADGFFSSRPRERVLEIMKDSRTGSMGVFAVVALLCLKIAAIFSIPGVLRWPTLLLMPVAGRCALVLELAALPYARPEGGLGALFAASKTIVSPLFATVALTICAWWAMGRVGLAAAGTTVVLTIVFSFWCWRKIGGFTGDTLGAACEIAELAPALVAVMAVR
jgi:adenosylcobinamide-GDP ribazoletransferase